MHLLLLPLALTGCILVVDGKGSFDDDRPVDTDQTVRDTADDPLDTDANDTDDTDVPTLNVDALFAPDEIFLGRTTIVIATILGDVGAADLTDVVFTPDANVLTFSALNETEVAIALEAPPGTLGSKDATLTFGDLGSATFDDVVTVVLAGPGPNPHTGMDTDDTDHACGD